MLEELAKNDKLWRKHAYRFCKCKHLADEIVQDMYLRFHRNPKDNITEYYVVLVIKSVWMNHIKTKKREVSTEQLYYIESKESTFEADDEQQMILDNYKKLDWYQKELLAEIYDRSLREIEAIYPFINYAFAYRQIKEAKQILLDR